MLEQHRALMDGRNSSAQGGLWRGRFNRNAVKRNRAEIGPQMARQYVHQGGFARAVLSKQRMDFSRSGAEIDSVKGDGRAEVFGNCAGFQQVLHLRRDTARSGLWSRMEMAAHPGNRGVTIGQFTVELEIFDLLEDGFEIRTWRESHRDQVVGVEQAR